MKKLILLILSILPLLGWAQIETSIAGFFQLKNSGRKVYNFNPGWRFYKGNAAEAYKIDFNDSDWEIVTTPHTVELMPAEASGCRNYQGIAWYRKRFVIPKEVNDKNVTLHFEAVMGKQTIYVNGKMVKNHLGGYLPFNINLTQLGINAGDSCLIAVMTNNSDDKSFPPGKPQKALDFAYHGGIYRDVWMIAKSSVAITDAVESNRVAGGGIFVHYDNISDKNADVFINTEVENNNDKITLVTVVNTLIDKNNNIIGKASSKLKIAKGEVVTAKGKIKVKYPELWSPQHPYLYRLETKVIKEGKSVDGVTLKIGIRNAEFDSKKGFLLNGKPYGMLVGANRHQDFAYVGNALPNSQQWRDAKRLRNAGCTIIRTAHYPQDPSFMDACDELGLFVIVATPGWQYWNSAKQFRELVHENTRQIIRRDRNHPSVLMWEPILNETRFPLEFAIEALNITKNEYPYSGRPLAAADMHSAGVADNYDIVYGWPGDDKKVDKPKQCIFTREFGENVDDWYAHNNNNRASRSWGERPLVVQALSLAKSYDELYNTTGQFIGGAQWHPFDHQRGYHPDPYWGGIFDAFRQPKYAYEMFRSQRSVSESGPMVYIAHEMTQFSDQDVVVFSNCDSVKMSIYDGIRSMTLPVIHEQGHMPSQPVIFKNIWNFWEARKYSYLQKNWQKVNIVIEGIIDGKVVCKEKKMPSRRSTKLRLYADTMGKQLVADGSDFIVVVAEITDDNGNVKRLAKDNIVFTVEGEGNIIGDASINANPRAVEFGSAPVLIRSTMNPGKIKVKAHVQFEGIHAPASAELEFESVPSIIIPNYIEESSANKEVIHIRKSNIESLTLEQKEILLKEVEQQQTEFGIAK